MERQIDDILEAFRDLGFQDKVEVALAVANNVGRGRCFEIYAEAAGWFDGEVRELTGDDWKRIYRASSEYSPEASQPE